MIHLNYSNYKKTSVIRSILQDDLSEIISSKPRSSIIFLRLGITKSKVKHTTLFQLNLPLMKPLLVQFET